MKREVFELKSGGNRIAGIFDKPDATGPFPVMILCHGLTNDKFTCPLIERASELFVSNGMAALRFDFFGSGESDGMFKDKTISTMIRNLEDVIDYLFGRKDVDPARVGLWGRSVGGAAVAACSEPSRIRTNFLVSAPALLHKTFYPLYERFGRADFSPIGKAISDAASGKVKGELELPRKFFEELLDVQGKIDANLSVMRSVLIVQGGRDKKVSTENAHFIFEKVREPKHLEIIDGADHAYVGYEDRVLELVDSWARKYGIVGAKGVVRRESTIA